MLLGSFGLVLVGVLAWSFRKIPGERWQIMASVPVSKTSGTEWVGANLTWYGFFSASAYVVAAMVFFTLLAALGIRVGEMAALIVAMLAIAIPSATVVARIVEKKRNTFTVGGAVFVSGLVAPILVPIVAYWFRGSNALELVVPTLAAMTIAYTFGEGLGRLACLSFGCCYGKPVASLGPRAQRFLGRFAVSFAGATRKASYASNLEGIKLVPIQAITSSIYTLCGLGSLFLFLYGHYVTAFLVALTVSQGWRAASEFLRADYRGEGRISAYQIMAVITIVYSAAALAFFPLTTAVRPSLAAGLAALWTPGLILSLQALWVALFAYTGLSRVTGSRVSFHVHQHRI